MILEFTIEYVELSKIFIDKLFGNQNSGSTFVLQIDTIDL